MTANLTRQQLIEMARNPETRHVPKWAAEYADKIETATTEREATLWENRLAGALGYYTSDDDE